MSGNLLVYDEEAYEKCYSELKTYEIAVPADPVQTGFNGLCELFSKVQAYRERVSQMFSEAVRTLARAKVQMNSAKRAYETALDIVIDTDPEIIKLPSDRTKVARANRKLAAEVERMHESINTFHMIDAYYEVVKNRADILSTANKAITEQTNLYKKLIPPTDGRYTLGNVPVRIG
jgi:hypothetical protein